MSMGIRVCCRSWLLLHFGFKEFHGIGFGLFCDVDVGLVLFVGIFVAGCTFVLPIGSVNAVADG